MAEVLKLQRTVKNIVVMLGIVLFFSLCLFRLLNGICYNPGFDDEFIYNIDSNYKPLLPPLITYESNGLLFYLLADNLYFYICDNSYSSLNANSGIIVLRSFSLVFSILSLPAMYFLGLALNGRKAGLCCSFILGIHILFLQCGCTGRFYATNLFFVILSLLFLVQACLRNRWYLWILYAISIVCMVSTMILSFSLLPCHIFIFLAFYKYMSLGRHKAVRYFTISMVIIFSAFIWLILRNAIEGVDFEYAQFDKHQFYHGISSVLGHGANYCTNNLCGRSLISEHFQDTELEPIVVEMRNFSVIISVIATVVSLLPLPKRKISEYSKEDIIAWAFFWGITFALTILLIYSYAIKNIFVNRQLSSLVPVVCLGVGVFISRSKCRTVIFLFSILLSSPYTVACTGLYNEFNPKIVSWLEEQKRIGDCFLIDRHFVMPKIPDILVNKFGFYNYSADISSCKKTFKLSPWRTRNFICRGNSWYKSDIWTYDHYWDKFNSHFYFPMRTFIVFKEPWNVIEERYSELASKVSLHSSGNYYTILLIDLRMRPRYQKIY